MGNCRQLYAAKLTSAPSRTARLVKGHDRDQVEREAAKIATEKAAENDLGMTPEEEDAYVTQEQKDFAASIGMRIYTDAELKEAEEEDLKRDNWSEATPYSPADMSTSHASFSYADVSINQSLLDPDPAPAPPMEQSDDEADEAEEDRARLQRNLEKLNNLRRKKEREKEERKQKEKVEKAAALHSRKRKPSSDLIESTSKSAVMSSLLAKVVDIKCEPNTNMSPVAPPTPPPTKVAKEKPEKKRPKPTTPPRPAPAPPVQQESRLKPELKKKSSSSAVSFSKAKKADSKSEESASTLRPMRDPSRSRDPRAEMLRRHAELGVAPPEKKRPTDVDPLKPTVRIAYNHRTGSGLSLDPVQISSCPTPLQKRYEVLKIMMRESRRLYPTNQEVQKQVAIEQELKLAKRAKTKSAYTSLSAALIKRFREAGPGLPNAREFAPSMDITKLPSGIDFKQALLDPTIISQIEKKKAQSSRLSGIKFHRALLPYVMSLQQLTVNNYPIPSKENKKIVNINDLGRLRQKITGQNEKRICTRCGVVFYVRDDGATVTGGECNYHGGKLYADRTSHHFSCCQGTAGADPCKYADTHVHEENRADLSGYNSTASLKKVQAIDRKRTEPGVYGLDCEMIYTTVGFELARVTVVNDLYDVVLDKFVAPAGRVLDLNEKYSGIQARDIDPKNKKCAASLKDARNMVRAIISDECYILGHSLESDLTALRLTHLKCIDTSVVFPHKRGLPYKRALKTLMQEHCGLVIQQEGEGDEFGHDSAQDAIACMKLMLWKIEQDIKSGKVQV